MKMNALQNRIRNNKLVDLLALFTVVDVELIVYLLLQVLFRDELFAVNAVQHVQLAHLDQLAHYFNTIAFGKPAI